MKYNVFIDGAEGTTGLKIHQYFQKRDDIQLIQIDADKRKDLDARLSCMKQADISFLCLPDAAAREIAAAAPADCRILDTSTAHRTAPDWVYGMPELYSTQREKIKASNRVAVPGCHATGVILLVAPLIRAGILPADYPVAATSLTGYSGGGKKMIADYESDDMPATYTAPRQYALGQSHKHLKEMSAVTGLKNAPIFCPIVSDFYSGMCVTVPLFKEQLLGRFSLDDIKKVYKNKYTGPVVTYTEDSSENGFLSAAGLSHKDSMQVCVYGNDDRVILTALYDNLGKGASGAAVECLNYVLGTDIVTGLEL